VDDTARTDLDDTARTDLDDTAGTDVEERPFKAASKGSKRLGL